MKNQKCCRLHCDDDPNKYTSSSKAINKGILMLDNKRQSNKRYKKRNKKYRLDRSQVGPDQYVFYSVLNTDVVMEPKVAAHLIVCSILMLHKKLETDQTKRQYIKEWEKSGKNIIILRGSNNKHLKYLERETKYTALDNQAIQLYHSQIMLVLSVFGRKSDIEEIFEGIPLL